MCENCCHCEYKPVGDGTIGSNEKYKTDWYCWYWRKWLGDPSGKCKEYVAK